MSTFEAMQIAGLSPSLLSNRLGLSSTTLGLLFSKIKVLENGCWEWIGAKAKGYGVVKIRAIRSTPLSVHRLCYETVHGKTDDALDLHHKVEDGCIGPACCNPAHLKPCSRREHLAELTPSSLAFINSRAATCVKGHIYSIETTRLGGNGARRCLICERERAQKARDEKLASEGREKFRWREEHKKTHCKRGHPMTPDNLYFQGRYASCLTCRREYHRRSE